jgi:hypothetical protein
MSPLANRMYKQLLRRLRGNQLSITYGELAHAISGKRPLHHRSRKLHAALGEITDTCRAQQLPCIPAMVWRHDRQRPGDGYYRYAHPRSRTDEARIAAWKREHAAVVAGVERFPASL